MSLGSAGEERGKQMWQPGVENADPRQRPLLPRSGERPKDRRTTKNRQELPAFGCHGEDYAA